MIDQINNNNNDFVIFENKILYRFFKRVLDIIVSSISIILLLPLFIIIAFLIKCISNGPIFYTSKRIGKDGKIFNMYKFRSMKINADKELESLLKHNETNGITFKMTNDPRVTKVGRFLRKTSLDELPQLFNILNGTMTIVGPRPALEREYVQYSEYQKQRLLVKQGLTCLWQCSGRSSLTFDDQVKLDLEYIKKRGFFYDIYIILKTIPAVLFGFGAK